MLIASLILTGCGGTAPASRGGSDSGAPQAAQPSRTLVIILRQEPAFLAGTAPTAANITTGTQRRLFNAGLVQEDSAGAKRPYLAETVPQLNTDSWKVSADGRMETTYRLKPNLAWHDGTPLTAADFVFSWKAYQVVELGVASGRPHVHMEEVSAPDPRTVLIKWKALYPEAGELEGSGGGGGSSFTPL